MKAATGTVRRPHIGSVRNVGDNASSSSANGTEDRDQLTGTKIFTTGHVEGDHPPRDRDDDVAEAGDGVAVLSAIDSRSAAISAVSQVVEKDDDDDVGFVMNPLSEAPTYKQHGASVKRGAVDSDDEDLNLLGAANDLNLNLEGTAVNGPQEVERVGLTRREREKTRQTMLYH
ncbi:MAG: hypothetical protein COB65_12350 [Thalassobium sp.]|nr:MAG: hypothetical protein COB65_12350 [Thalassobium sp.]